jgi:predicted SAM-dependent methyltransferase
MMQILNLGCGDATVDDWINADIYPLNNRIKKMNFLKGIPLSDNTLDAAYLSHVLEHLTVSQAKYLIRDLLRVLRPSGTLRIVVPDLENICRTYLQNLDSSRKDKNIAWKREWMVVEMIDQIARKNSGGLMAKWYTGPAKVSEEINSYIYQRVGERVVMGSTRKYVNQKNWEFPETKIKRFFDRKKNFVPQGESHNWMWDEMSLTEFLLSNGFSQVSKQLYNTSNVEMNLTQLDVDEKKKED